MPWPKESRQSTTSSFFGSNGTSLIPLSPSSLRPALFSLSWESRLAPQPVASLLAAFTIAAFVLVALQFTSLDSCGDTAQLVSSPLVMSSPKMPLLVTYTKSQAEISLLPTTLSPGSCSVPWPAAAFVVASWPRAQSEETAIIEHLLEWHASMKETLNWPNAPNHFNARWNNVAIHAATCPVLICETQTVSR